MTTLKTIKLIAGAIAFTIVLFSQTAFAQKYKTATDTVKLNKEYGEVTLDIAKLNADLIREQNKTSGYQSKTASTAQNAVSSAQYSKETASTATNGSVADAKTAMKQARKANNKANDAEDARNDQANNGKKIASINKKIEKKQAVLADLARQKADILAQSSAASPAKL